VTKFLNRSHTTDAQTATVDIYTHYFTKLMTIQQAEAILSDIDVRIALQHRFAGDKEYICG
jgi:hypothetical protein